MLDRLRGTKRSVLKEDMQGFGKAVEVTDDPTFGEKTLTTQKTTVSNALGVAVNWGSTPLRFYPETQDITLDGQIVELNNLRFQYRLKDPSGTGCYIWCQGLQLTDENLKKIGSIYSIYQNWRDEWVKNSGLLENFADAVKEE